ncbi:hypothetical protein HDU96_007079 [Phlyctochytrium bullatum]|nr:hypothetical protein HDU96_007079 [Phlyctochytrium bullatum]
MATTPNYLSFVGLPENAETFLVNAIDFLRSYPTPDFPYNTTEKAKEWLDSMATIGDNLADKMVEEHGAAVHLKLDAFDDMELAEKLGVTETPEWVNEEQIKRAQQFFFRHLSVIFDTLLHLSLAGGFGVPRIDKVLLSTGYLSDPKRSYLRLLETTAMILDAMQIGELTKIGGKGWRHVLKVRLMHAGVRVRLRKSKHFAGSDSVPINQADMNATLWGFQSVLMLGLVRLGVHVTMEEAEDYTNAWRFIGHLIGIEDRFNGCQWGVDPSIYLVVVYSDSYSFVRRAVREISLARAALPPPPPSKPDLDRHDSKAPFTPDNSPTAETTSSDIASALALSKGVVLAAVENSPLTMSYPAHIALMRVYNGEAFCDCLGLPRVGFWYYLQVYHRVAMYKLVDRLYGLPWVGEWLLNRVSVQAPKFLEKEMERIKEKMEGKKVGKNKGAVEKAVAAMLRLGILYFACKAAFRAFQAATGTAVDVTSLSGLIVSRFWGSRNVATAAS